MGRANISITLQLEDDDELEAAINDLNLPEGAGVVASFTPDPIMGTIGSDGSMKALEALNPMAVAEPPHEQEPTPES